MSQPTPGKVTLLPCVTAQGGFCVAELLLAKRYKVHGIKRRLSLVNAARTDHGLVQEIPRKEPTPLCLCSLYTVAKLYVYWITVNYRAEYDLYACNGIPVNRESSICVVTESLIKPQVSGLSDRSQVPPVLLWTRTRIKGSYAVNRRQHALQA